VARAVGRGVVDHDQLEARAILGEHAGEGARQAGRAVIGREDDGNVRQVGQSSEAPVEASPYHAGASAARATGFTTIGRLISAESTPNSTESHHTGSYEWVYSNAKLPSSTPRKPPTWWLKNAKPNSMASQRVPNITATRPEVGGTVESQRKPVTAPNTSAEPVLAGSVTKATIASARPK